MACSRNPEKVFRASTGRTHYTRLTRLLICGGTTILRELFDSIHPPANLSTVLTSPIVSPTLSQMKKKRFLTLPQWKILFPSPGTCGQSKTFDITLLCKLFREICNLTAPATGWDCLPICTDLSLTADLARIKYFRNEIYGHVNEDMELSDEEFVVLWNDIKDALVRIVKCYATGGSVTDWENAIDDLLTAPLTDEDEIHLEELQHWYLGDMEVKKTLEETRRETEETRRTAEETRRTAEETKRETEETRRTAEETKRETEETRRAAEETRDLIRTMMAAREGLQQPGVQAQQQEQQQLEVVVQCLFKFASGALWLAGSALIMNQPSGDIEALKTVINHVVLPTGILVYKIVCGSIKLFTRVKSLDALTELWKRYKEGQLKTDLEKVFITKELIAMAQSDIELIVSIDEIEYLKAQQVLQTKDPSHQNLVAKGKLESKRTPLQTPRVQSLIAAVSNDECCLPMGVKIVCDHFLAKFQSFRFGVNQATHVCDSCKKKCQEKHPSVHLLIRYAFWSEGFKQWFVIRPYPRGELSAPFQQCKDFENNRPCTRGWCTFAHEPELSMWTMEREETLVQPWKALFRHIVYIPTNQLMDVVRPLLPGASKGDLSLCNSVQSGIICRCGRGCRFAHSETELDSWKKLYQERLEEIRIPDNKQSLKHHELQYTDSIPGVELTCNPEVPNVQLAEDCNDHSYTWEFCARFEVKLGLPAVELLNFRSHFHFTKVKVVGFDRNNEATTILFKELRKAEHIPQEKVVFDSKIQKVEFRVSIAFQASVFGSFSQRLLFNFGRQPFLKKDFNIDIGSKETLEKLADRRKMVILDALPWDDGNMTLIRSEPDPEKEKLMSAYRLPKDAERIVSAQLVEGEIRRDTYKQTMHQLLFAEEVHMRKLLLSITPTAVKLQPVTTKPDLRFGGTKFAEKGQLFGKIELGDIEITPDDMAGRVCLRNVQHIWILSRDKPKCLYELLSEIHEGNTIYVDLAPNLCKDLKLSEGRDVDVEMRFKLNRYILCMMHKAVDSLGYTQAQQLFPVEQVIRRKKVTDFWGCFLDQRLNECQKHVIQAIAEVVPPSPPLVVFGPFGSGKTFTLNQAVIYLMKEKANRVLLCTHTNSAADIHVELLDKYLHGNGVLSRAAKPLRIYDPQTEWSRTSDVGRNYALVKDGVFLMPTRKNIIDHRVVITTLTAADLLTKLNVHHGFFTHILIDEAAQVWETEALIPLALAGPNTKVVFTGDHMQMSPEVYSEFARHCGLQKSLPERLFDHYQSKDNKDEQVLFLFENYRSNEEILNFPSANSYQNGIVAKGNIPCHPELSPLIFYAAKGKDEKQSNNSFLNSSEVYEVGKRVAELVEKWPLCWGKKNLQEIAVVAPYKYQVDAIREELRRKRMSQVNVQTIHNIQGREFRALFISTVRTWNSIQEPNQSDEFCGDDLSLEFLSDPKLLITAVTRAKSLVAVVGDPFALCTLGRCKILWNDYITRCYNRNGLIGITWEDLSEEINAHFSQIRAQGAQFR